MRSAYRLRPGKPTPPVFQELLLAILEQGTAKAIDLQAVCSTYAPTTIITALSGMHNASLVQHLPGRLWGLTESGIEQALQVELDRARERNAKAKREEDRIRAMSPRRQSNLEARTLAQAHAQHIGAMRRQGEVI